jgi:acetylornithine/succinyldiaminopimelate/putrescine aminotransferase
MKNDELRRWYRHHGPVGPDAPEPVFAGKGEGAWLEDDVGKKLLDFSSGGSAPLGRNHPDIIEAVNRIGHAPAAEGVVTSDEVALMHKLAELVPGGMNRRVLICESGREALARAIELARNRTNRTSVTYLSECSQEKPTIGRDVAAVVAHPLDGRVRYARQACDAASALLIDDEAGIGPGTTGRMLAIELSDVRPDVYVLGRGWAAGFPFGACVTGSSDLRWKCAPAGNPIGSAVALETIRLLESGLPEKGRKLAAYLEKRFAALSSPKLEPELWGVGLVRTLVFRKGKGVAEGFVQKCLEFGLMLYRLAETVAIRPPLVASEKDVDFAAGVIGKVLAGFDKKA